MTVSAMPRQSTGIKAALPVTAFQALVQDRNIASLSEKKKYLKEADRWSSLSDCLPVSSMARRRTRAVVAIEVVAPFQHLSMSLYPMISGMPLVNMKYEGDFGVLVLFSGTQGCRWSDSQLKFSL